MYKIILSCWSSFPMHFQYLAYVLLLVLILYLCLLLPVSFPIQNFLVSSCGLFFSVQRSSFRISYKTGLVVLNSLSFFLSVKPLISLSNLCESLADQKILVCRFFPFITLNISRHFWPEGFLMKNLLITLWEFLCILFVALILLLIIFLFVFNFCQFDYCVSWYIYPWIYPAQESLHFLGLGDYFLSHIREVFSYYLFKYFLMSFLSLSAPLGTL